MGDFVTYKPGLITPFSSRGDVRLYTVGSTEPLEDIKYSVTQSTYRFTIDEHGAISPDEEYWGSWPYVVSSDSENFDLIPFQFPVLGITVYYQVQLYPFLQLGPSAAVINIYETSWEFLNKKTAIGYTSNNHRFRDQYISYKGALKDTILDEVVQNASEDSISNIGDIMQNPEPTMDYDAAYEYMAGIAATDWDVTSGYTSVRYEEYYQRDSIRHCNVDYAVIGDGTTTGSGTVDRTRTIYPGYTFSYGTATGTATPNPGSVFAGWYNGDTADTRHDNEIHRNIKRTAIFV